MDRLPKFLRSLLPALLVTGGALAATGAAVPAYLSAAIADPSRPAADTARDADRKPAQVHEAAPSVESLDAESMD